MTPAVSVVIATYNRSDSLRRTLASLFEQDVTDCEVIVVVDGSTDDTVAMLQEHAHPQLTVLEQQNRGQAAARNAGIHVARGELVLFLDDDLVCRPGLVQAHRDAHVAAGPLVTFGAVIAEPGDDSGLARYLEQLVHRRATQPAPIWPDDAHVAANTAVPRALLLEVGGFDDRFAKAIEDIDLGFRLWSSGVRFRFLPDAVAYHRDCKTVDQQLAHARAWGANEVLLCRKHPAYRPFSTIGQLRSRPRWKSAVQRVVARWPRETFAVAHSAFTLSRSRTALRAAKRALFWQGVHAAAGEHLERELGMTLPVLLYHHVGVPVRHIYPMTIEPPRFAAQMQWLAEHGFTAIKPSDWLRWCVEGRPLPDKPVLITFDDAYADLHEHAFPVLEQLGFAAAVYVPSMQMGATNAWDEARGAGTLRVLAAEQLAAWASRGIEVGAHGATHRDLSTLSDAELDAEIAGSRATLERALGCEVTSFVYPFGCATPAAARRVATSYPMAFVAREGLNHLGIPLHELRRTEVKPSDSLLDFAVRVKFGRHPLHSLRARLARR